MNWTGRLIIINDIEDLSGYTEWFEDLSDEDVILSTLWYVNGLLNVH